MDITRRSARAPQRGATRKCLESLYNFCKELRPFGRHRQRTSNLISMFPLPGFESISSFRIKVLENVHKNIAILLIVQTLDFQRITV